MRHLGLQGTALVQLLSNTIYIAHCTPIYPHSILTATLAFPPPPSPCKPRKKNTQDKMPGNTAHQWWVHHHISGGENPSNFNVGND